MLILLAIAMDLLVGEPPEAIHPVVWFGKLISFMEKLNDLSNSPLLKLLFGALTTLLVVVFSLSLYFVSSILPQPISLIAKVYLLKSSFSVRSMIEHVNDALKSNVSPEKVQMLVSRNAWKLNYSERCSALIETLAENFVDSVFAPLFYFSIFGLAGALIYRAVNTCDAMIGYKNEKYYWFGKFSARLDDVLNLLPARISVIIFAIVSKNLRVLRALTENLHGKVNACSMIAMAYALSLKLEKPGYYVINKEGKIPEKRDVERALKFFKISSFISFLLFSLFYYW